MCLFSIEEFQISGWGSSISITSDRVHVRKIRLKLAKKCCLYLDIFSCEKINVFRPFFAFRLKYIVKFFAVKKQMKAAKLGRSINVVEETFFIFFNGH